MTRVLVVDDEPILRQAVARMLTHHGYAIESVSSGEEALAAFEREAADLLVLDITMPGIDGIATLTRLRERDPDVSAVFITAHGSVRSAVEAMRAGGFDYLLKPFDNDALLLTVQRALERRGLRQEVKRLRSDLDARARFTGITGKSPAMLEALRQLAKVAPTETTVLLLGESGTGKELAARHLHRQSRRAGGPFVAVNCGAIPAELAEAELFGHERGAFTGATDARVGSIEQAHGGTLLLDEVGELPMVVQTKLLRVLQEREVVRLGGRRATPINVRVVAATNRDLDVARSEGQFRDDLYFRLGGFSVRLPALREREEDLPLLVDHLVDRLNAELGLRVSGVTSAASQRLAAHTWPGNVRELENVLRRAMIMAEGTAIDVADLPDDLGSPTGHTTPAPAPIQLSEVVARATERIERTIIEAALHHAHGNRAEAAEALGISRRTLFRKLGGRRAGDEESEPDE
jgi:two-component system response regulator AtoC